MDTAERERREQELEQNELAKALGKAGEKVGGQMPALVGGGLALLVTLLLAAFLLRDGETTTDAAWSDYMKASGPDGYEEVAERYADTPVAGWALVRAGRQRLNSGVQRAFTDRVQSDEDLAAAKKLFESALDAPETTDELEMQALQGIAVATEAMVDGTEASIQRAIEAYQPLLNSGLPLYVGQAEARIEALESESTKAFYAYLASAERKPAERPSPLDGLLSSPDQVIDGKIPEDRLPSLTQESIPPSEVDLDGRPAGGESMTEDERAVEPPPDTPGGRTPTPEDMAEKVQTVAEDADGQPEEQNPSLEANAEEAAEEAADGEAPALNNE